MVKNNDEIYNSVLNQSLWQIKRIWLLEYNTRKIIDCKYRYSVLFGHSPDSPPPPPMYIASSLKHVANDGWIHSLIQMLPMYYYMYDYYVEVYILACFVRIS